MIFSPRTGPRTETAAEDDEALGALIDELTDRLQGGEAVDLEACVRLHPGHEGQIRGLFPALEMMAALGRRSADGGASGQPPPGGDPRLDSGVLGDYRIVREVGRGGMGIVFEAVQVPLGRRVALKILPLAAAVDPRHLQRFQLEAQAAAHLHHPHIVPIFAVGCDRGVHYYAMQFIDGRSLADLVAESRRGPAEAPSADFDLAGEGPSSEGGAATPDPTADADPPPPAGPPGLPSDLGVRSSCLPSPFGRGAGGEGRLATGGLRNWLRRKPPDRPHPSPRPSPKGRGSRTLPGLTGTVGSSGPRGGESARSAARLGVQAAEALEHAHALGVLHRDIKPANLLVQPDGHLWVADFGLARFGADADLTRTGDILGTLRYMSPEQATARRSVDHRADIYSLGATLYELLTARPAFDGHDRQELIRRIALEDPTPPRQLDPTIPRDLETIVLKALAKEPEGRYATALELAEDLGRFLEDGPILARRPGLAERAARWSRRHRAALTSAAAVLILAMPVGTALLWQAARQTEREKTEAQRAYDQNRKILDLVFSRSEQLNMQAMGAITRANNQGLGEDGSYIRMVAHFYQDMIDQAGDDPDMAELKARSYHRVGFCRMVLKDVGGAQDAFRRSIDLFEGLLARSPGHPTLGWLLASVLQDRGMMERLAGPKGRPTGRSDDDFRRAIALRQEAATRSAPDAETLGMLAWSQLEWAGHLDDEGRPAEAEATRRQLLEFYRKLVPALPRRPGDRRAYAQSHIGYGADWFPTPHRLNSRAMFQLARVLDPDDPTTLNDIAWTVASRPETPTADLAQALDLIREAVAKAPDDGSFRNTLGVVRYRLGDWKGAVEALEDSVRLRDGGDPFDWLFLAMARHRLGERDVARRWLEKSVARAQETTTDNEEVKRFRSEAESLLGPRVNAKQSGPPD